jgi:hypothetical protein
MGWKTINGRQYYYRSVREGVRVRSEYVGGGIDAGLIARLEAIDRERRLTRRHDEKAAREKWAEIEKGLENLVADARRAAAEALRAAGYHQHHRGEWRRKRRG